VVRSTDGIRAPSVLKLDISYRIITGILPAYVLARDSGSFRDQSDANRTAGAIVEAFVPLAVMLGRLTNTGATAVAPAAAECPPECQCSGAGSTDAAGVKPAAGSAGTSSVIPAPPATGRTLLVGLTAPPSEAPVNVLLLADRERDYTALAPMKIEALVADRFVPIVADDTTRALGESGVLSMSFTLPPTPRELFGQTLSWLRMTPSLSPPAAATPVWSPTLRGVYLNAVWASATETLTRELLGSSDGAPGMTFTVARPPLLKDSLELRVREPLGDEERLDLQTGGDRLVLSNAEGLRGDWVLWKRVIDPGDEDPDARVYGLDETTGKITFGDGLHGMIPPIGRDSIVAFSYQRTETGADASGAVPGNSIAPRSPFNLVSPVEGVEAVVAADQAAGGAPPESDDRVLRFGFARLRHRRRVVTARDVEDLALQSSPDFAQASCLIRRGYARLVVVMRGDNPQPNASQVRELRRVLLDASPVTLAAPGALRIEGPAVRKVRIDLTLRVQTLDQAGDVGRDVKKRLAQLFDNATGGADGLGWPLGQSPTDADIAYALMDLPSLESVADVALRESEGPRSDTAWPQSFKPNELAVLAEDPVRLTFVTAEVTA
jgi:predicted phage baseplate assembly protein